LVNIQTVMISPFTTSFFFFFFYFNWQIWNFTIVVFIWFCYGVLRFYIPFHFFYSFK
jgi:hypothetical protein